MSEQLFTDNPDIVPEYVVYNDSQIAYIVGFWWLALDDGQKKKALENHPVFSEKYSWQTCADYANCCNKLPRSASRLEIIKKVPMKTARLIVNATSDNQEAMNMLFNVALTLNISARNMQTVIEEWKQKQKRKSEKRCNFVTWTTQNLTMSKSKAYRCIDIYEY